MNRVDHPFQSPVILSLCPGILGLERGLELAIGQVRVAAYCEREAFVCQNLVTGMEQGLLAPAPIWTDVATFPAEVFRGKIHGFVGGYPCQPFSNAGKRGGAEDPRHLFPHILRHIRTIRPVWCWFENVRGHLSMGYDEVYRSLREAGYNVECGIYSAEEVGAPHQRDRLFILAILADANGAQWWEDAKRWINESYRSKGGREEEAGRFELRGEELADSNGNGPGTDAGGLERSGNQNEGEVQRKKRDGIQRERCGGYAGDIGSEVGNSIGRGFEEQRNDREQVGEGDDRFGYTGAAGVGLADSCCTGLERRGEQFARSEQSSLERSGRIHRWPARPGQSQHEWEAPRTIERLLGSDVDGNQVEINNLLITYIDGKIRTGKLLLELYGFIEAKEVWESPGGPWSFLEEEIFFNDLLSRNAPQKLVVHIVQQAKSVQAQSGSMRGLQNRDKFDGPSQGHESLKQCTEQFKDAMRVLSYQIALAGRQARPEESLLGTMHSLWNDWAHKIENVPEALSEAKKVWLSIFDHEKNRETFFRACREYLRELNPYNFREDLLRALGNSVVEQQAEYAFRDLLRKHFERH